MGRSKSINNKQGAILPHTYRILDANFNRAKEGLRVCEDICRFYLQDQGSSRRLRAFRHKLTSMFQSSSLVPLLLFQNRDVKNDLGKFEKPKIQAKTFKGIFIANAQRVKEALRVIEEFLKLIDLAASHRTQQLRFSFYAFEKNTIEKFPALLDTR